ncbi:MAG: SDR family oxidoreductase, partial [Deltaproteobacteria bacterium]|nr:SDR family oxidoreductase [Deltaproteobacteria bacterium]
VEEWQSAMRVNIDGAFFCSRAVVPVMQERKWGRIINISSGAATGGLHKQVGYAASKAGILGLTKTVTLEHARDGITCNAVLPGLIGTELVSMMPVEIRDVATRTIPTRRIGEMQEVAYLISFLASERSAYINGVEIPIDGGMMLNTGSLGSRREVGQMHA